MEDLWLIRKSSIEINEFADIAEYKRYLKRFSESEEKEHRKNLLYNITHPNDEGKPAPTE